MKTRFCPSPTGEMHLGNARTALFNALAALANNGEFVLRIEDTDPERSKDEYATLLQHDLHWLGIQWQQGPEQNAPSSGVKGPYWQSQRQAIYAKHYAILAEKGLTYPCFCTPEQLALSRKLQRAQGKAPRYVGTCRSLSVDEINTKLAQGLKPSVRFKVFPKQTIQFHDLVKGRQRFLTDDIGDFIIRKADLSPAFFFCNALDDALMGVTHALRGEDHLTNTPRQLLLLKALDLPAPEYGHISLIIGSDGSPLSKRHGSRSVKELRQQGFLPLAITNYLARLGHYYADNQLMSLPQLAAQFDFANLGKAPARFDANQLLYWQKEALNTLDDVAVWEWMGTEVHAQVPPRLKKLFVQIVKANVVFPLDALAWAKHLFAGPLEFSAPQLQILTTAGSLFFTTAVDLLQDTALSYQTLCEGLKQTLQVKGKALFLPLRMALTAQQHGPEMAQIFELLGVEEVRKRLAYAAKVQSL